MDLQNLVLVAKSHILERFINICIYMYACMCTYYLFIYFHFFFKKNSTRKVGLYHFLALFLLTGLAWVRNFKSDCRTKTRQETLCQLFSKPKYWFIRNTFWVSHSCLSRFFFSLNSFAHSRLTKTLSVVPSGKVVSDSFNFGGKIS